MRYFNLTNKELSIGKYFELKSNSKTAKTKKTLMQLAPEIATVLDICYTN
jgi:cation transport ATPase